MALQTHYRHSVTQNEYLTKNLHKRIRFCTFVITWPFPHRRDRAEATQRLGGGNAEIGRRQREDSTEITTKTNYNYGKFKST